MFNNFFFSDDRAVNEIMWKNTVEPGRPQTKIWGMHIACWIPKAINTHSEFAILFLLFHGKSGCTDAYKCYVILTLSVSFHLF